MKHLYYGLGLATALLLPSCAAIQGTLRISIWSGILLMVLLLIVVIVYKLLK